VVLSDSTKDRLSTNNIVYLSNTTPTKIINKNKKMTDLPVVNVLEVRAVISFCVLRRLKNSTIHEQLCEAYGAAAPSLSVVKDWAKRFRDGRETLEDDPRSGRPKSADFGKLVSDVLDEMPFASARYIAETISCSHTTVLNTLSVLGYKKFLSRWVPHVLTEGQKNSRVKMSQALLAQLDSLLPSHLSSMITCDESWFYLDYPEKGRWSKDRKTVEPRPKRDLHAKKVMLTVFWSSRGFHLIDALPAGETFDSNYACVLLDRLDQSMRAIRPKMGLHWMLLHWDNARPHSSHQTRNKIQSLGLSQPLHPPYSPDLAPSDFFLFGFIKEKLKGNSFQDTESLIAWVSSVIRAIPKETLFSVFMKWRERLLWVIEHDGEYFIN
jgi:histone-lysine N-methyltransferase SETMAR